MAQTVNDTRNYILQAMVSMAAADGTVDERERATICEIYSDVSGEEATPATALDPLQIHRQSDLSFADQLAREAHRLTLETRETILQVAYRVLLADGRVAARERKKLFDFADALAAFSKSLT